MKNYFSFCLLVLALGLNAQNGLNNLSFENWSNTVIGKLPVGWVGDAVSQQTTGAQNGSSYVRITTTYTGSFSDGYFGLGNPAVGFGPLKTHFTQKPISLNGFFKTSGLVAGDSIRVAAWLSASGIIPATAQADFYYSNNVANWTSFSATFTYVVQSNSDSIIVCAYSNIKLCGGGANAIGSTLDLDNLSFAIPNEIDEASIGTSFLVYPNPTNNELNIISKNERTEMLRIIDVNGKVMDEIIMEVEKTRVDLEKYSPGIYFYSILDKDLAGLLSSKFIISR